MASAKRRRPKKRTLLDKEVGVRNPIGDEQRPARFIRGARPQRKPMLPTAATGARGWNKVPVSCIELGERESNETVWTAAA